MFVANVIFFVFIESQIFTFKTRFWLKFIKEVCIDKLLRWQKFWNRKIQNNNFYRLGLEKSQIHTISCPSAMPLLYQSFILNDFCRGPLSNSPIFGILQTKFLNLEAHRTEKDNGKMSQKQQSMFLHNFYNFRYLDVQLWINSVSSNSVLL